MSAYMADAPAAFRSLGLERGAVKPWEDGIRTDPSEHSYEWWYFDSHLEDGSSLVIVFFTKHLLSPHQPLTPMIEIELDRPDGTSIKRELVFAPGEFSAATDNCEVRIGPNAFAGDLGTYRIHVEDAEITADVTLTRAVPSWRPETGHMYFGDGEGGPEKLFAWLPSVPEGAVEATLTLNGTTETVRGTGYHDHNWGDAPMNQLIHHWWWGRAKVGPYTLISSYITAEEAYGSDEIPIFMIAKDGRILADDARHLSFSTSDTHLDEVTGKPVAGRQVYEYTDPDAHFRVTWRREQDIVRRNFIDEFQGAQLEAARAAGFDSSYLRFTGTATVERLEGGEVVESHTAPAIWELMYFGHAR
ncbi:lipocalin-like domain-containing protein [Streptomyces sp. GQFP]|uniref:lipocalin-like domain-containing protein n=1 Tax=Streptomyces sp. GQFP TaxID=2907545 RepID=UPI001F439055|nr:lipocalin-like domain-containing protein [Streptomyces sp. GQFP]UIX29254.1 hydroxyneurosporene dehydrogenase [Streptomyces sp. GQFP]